MLKIRKGYSMLEMIICIFILTSMTLLVLTNNSSVDLDGYYYLNNYLLLQSKAYVEKQEYDVDERVYFNHMGHVNQARTVKFSNHNVIIHLGNGYATFE